MLTALVSFQIPMLVFLFSNFGSTSKYQCTILLDLPLNFPYTLRNVSFSGPNPTNISSQHFTALPSPNSHFIILSNQFDWVLCQHTIDRSLHHQDSFWSREFSFIVLHKPYLDFITSFHSLCFFIPSLHFHFTNMTMLNCSISFMPRPPSSIGLHTFSILPMIFSFSHYLSPIEI